MEYVCDDIFYDGYYKVNNVSKIKYTPNEIPINIEGENFHVYGNNIKSIEKEHPEVLNMQVSEKKAIKLELSASHQIQLKRQDESFVEINNSRISIHVC